MPWSWWSPGVCLRVHDSPGDYIPPDLLETGAVLVTGFMFRTWRDMLCFLDHLDRHTATPHHYVLPGRGLYGTILPSSTSTPLPSQTLDLAPADGVLVLDGGWGDDDDSLVRTRPLWMERLCHTHMIRSVLERDGWAVLHRFWSTRDHRLAFTVMQALDLAAGRVGSYEH